MLYKINVAPRKGGLYRQCDIDNNLSVQHSALSTQHSALSTQHSALIPSSAAIGGSMPPNVQSSFYIAFPFLDSDFTDIAVISIFYKNRQKKSQKTFTADTICRCRDATLHMHHTEDT